MKNRDSNDALSAMLAVAVDLCTIWLAQMLAVWIRFDSGWIPLVGRWIPPVVRDPDLYRRYALAAAVVLPVYLIVFQILKLYSRPQEGTYSGKIPRIIRGCAFSVLIVLDISALLKNVIPFSNAAVLMSLATVTVLVLIERAVMFEFEIALARRSPPCHRALILGAGEDARRLVDALSSEPRLRTRAVGVLTLGGEQPHADLPAQFLCGAYADLERVVTERQIDQVILTGHALSHEQTVALILFCEQRLIRFNMVPDLFRMLTSRMEFNLITGIPLLGISRWPLDQVWNRVLKRALDMTGALCGLILAAPVMLVAALLIVRESPGPVFYVQERCGRRGRAFHLFKLRTMRPDAESGRKPGWTVAGDPRRTRVGAWLRKYNIDELPQFWNVLRGDMSLVGPRPERPYFVEQFTPGIAHYMWRHVSKPGLTGWAQVNGLRGDTSIAERVKYDLYYLEHWSLAFDIKILIRTLLAFKNAA
jgi:exopolysaccharide biosynthesis polyprenyl glycosylphosphotransferase